MTVTSRTQLNQGAVKAVADLAFSTGVGADIGLDSVTNDMPALAVGEFFEVRNHPLATNNGLYVIVTVNTSTTSYEADKVSGAAPVVDAAEACDMLGATGAATEKSVMIDTAGLGVYLLEQGNLDAEGATGGAVYSFIMQEWKDDDFIIANAPFPMNAIDTDAGKYIIGQDSSGNSNGWNWVDVPGFSIRTRKLVRNMGWDEIDAAGITKSRSFCCLSVDAVEDPANDTPFYQFGTDTTVDDTVDLTFAGPANEAIEFFKEIGNPTDCDFATASTITRSAGDFVADGYKVGGQVTVRDAENAAHDGTYVLTGVAALTLTVTGTPFTSPDPDATAQLAVDNSNGVRVGLRVRDADPFGKTFSESNLATIAKSALGNFIFQFPLPNAEDQKISASDATIAGSLPYTGMSITFHSTPQARAGLVGGSFNFGIIVEGNDGTGQEVFEFLQWSLRQLTDIDADVDTAIGRTIGLLARFNGDILEAGSGNGGLSFPVNPDGGGSGVYIDNLNAASANDVLFFDNTGTARTNPETIAVTLDFNQIAIDDALTEYDLFYDRTIRTPAATLLDLVITAGSPATMTSVGSDLPNNAELGVGSYVRVSGLTGGDAPMNGVYQVITETTPGAAWDVIRYDGVAIVTVTTTAVDMDQNCIDTPDAIIVNTNVAVSVNTISFTAPDQMLDSGSGLGVFASGDKLRIEGTTGGLNDGIFTVDTAVAGQIDFVEQTIVTQGASPTVTVTKIVSGLADADEVFSYDFDGNVQGGRSVSTDTFVKAKAVGFDGAQYVQSAVATIQSGVPLTIPLFAQTERNTA